MRLEKLSTMAISGGFMFAASVAVLPRTAHAAEPTTNPATQQAEEPTGDPIDVDKLPKVVVDAVKKDMPGSRITKAAKLDDGNYYLDDVKVGKHLWDVTVSPKGEMVKKVDMKD